MKTEIKNGILCGRLSLLYPENGIVAVDEAEIFKGEWFIHYSALNDDYTIEKCDDWIRPDDDGFYKIIASSASLNLPVLILPEREDVEKIIDKYYPRYEGDSGITDQLRKIFSDGFRAHAATHPYSLKDAREIFKAGISYGIKVEGLKYVLNEEITSELEKTMSSLRPKVIWCEVVERWKDTGDRGDGKHIYEIGHYQFKTNGKELIVIEWE